LGCSYCAVSPPPCLTLRETQVKQAYEHPRPAACTKSGHWTEHTYIEHSTRFYERRTYSGNNIILHPGRRGREFLSKIFSVHHPPVCINLCPPRSGGCTVRTR
ncbi:unnamed protein product, partial [Ectocarpus sp. 12 AP-2014]